jgi:hypothetical protein
MCIAQNDLRFLVVEEIRLLPASREELFFRANVMLYLMRSNGPRAIARE